MPGPFGVQPSGFVAKTFADIKSELEASWRATFGANVNLIPQSNNGQLIGIIADREADLWQLAEALYNSLSGADGAEGVPLVNLCGITGTTQDPPTKTRVLVTVTGTPGTVLLAGRQLSIAGLGQKFASVADATIPGGGTLAGVEFRAVDTGPTPCYAGTLTVIETPVAGWASATNPADHFQLGSNLESDAHLRYKREQELRAQGNAATEAVRQKVLKVANVTSCFVFENDTDTTNGDGLPPHSIEVLVQGGADQDILNAVYAAKAGGIATYGTTSGTVTDTAGTAHTVKFTRPTLVNIYVIVNGTKATTTEQIAEAGSYPADGDAQIKTAIVAYAAAKLRVGSDVISTAIGAQCFKVSGVFDVPAPFIGTAPAPGSSANIVIGTRQLAVFDTSRITISLV